MNWIDPLTTALISFVLGGGVIGYLKFYLESRKDNRSLLQEDLALYKDRYHELRQELDELSILLIPSSAPEWRKNYRGEYEYISPSYEISILLGLGFAKSDIIGKTDAEIFKSHPEFVTLLGEIDAEARKSPRRFAVRYNVYFPGNPEQMMVIKEIAQNISGRNYFIGRCYPYNEQTKTDDKGNQTKR